METVFISDASLPHSPSIYLCITFKFQLRKEKAKEMVKVQLLWQPTTERTWNKYKLSLLHTDTVIRCFEGSTSTVSWVGNLILQVLEL